MQNQLTLSCAEVSSISKSPKSSKENTAVSDVSRLTDCFLFTVTSSADFSSASLCSSTCAQSDRHTKSEPSDVRKHRQQREPTIEHTSLHNSSKSNPRERSTSSCAASCNIREMVKYCRVLNDDTSNTNKMRQRNLARFSFSFFNCHAVPVYKHTML